MKVLTLNTWQELGPWQERWEVTLRGLEQFEPEILAFQELFNRSWALEVQKRTGLPTLIFPEEPAGLVVLSRYPATAWGVSQLSQSPLEEYFRYLLWVELKVRGAPLFFFNTHLSWKLEDGATRRKQVGEVLELIQAKAGEREVVLVGDLNAPPDSPEIQRLILEGKFVDLFHEFHPQEAGFSWDNRNPYAGNSEHKMPNRRIDYVLARRSGALLKKPSRCDLVFTSPNRKGFWASDHFGVVAGFE